MAEGEKKKTKLSAEQKFGVGILVFFSVAVLGFGLWQFSDRIKAPFAGRATGLKNFKSLDQQKVDQMIAKQSKDTDGDGISDFDEEYVYHTSAYLADSDSDSYPDKQEIDSGNDPNCPSGKTCGLPEVTNTNIPVAAGGTEASGTETASGTAAAGAGSTATSLGGLNGADASQLADMQTLLGGQATPEAIRAALKDAGASDDVLNKVDDQTLMELYNESLKETNAAGTLQNINASAGPDLSNTNTNVPADINVANTNTSTNSVDNSLFSMTPAEARALLVQAGMDAATVNQIDDATIMQIMAQAMQ